MPRTRVISQSKAVYASPTGISGASAFQPTQLRRVDSFSFDIDYAGSRQDIREFGRLARISTVRASEITPTVSLGYYLTDGENEKKLGLSINGLNGNPNSVTTLTGVSQFISGILSEDIVEKEKNLYVVTVAEGKDAFSPNFTGERSQHTTIAFGNATPTTYTANFAVGEIPRADVELECGNIVFLSGSSGINPAVNRQTAAYIGGTFVLPTPSTGSSSVDVLKHGDVRLMFSNNGLGVGGVKFNDIHAQSASVEVPLSRESIERLGSQLPYAKPLEFPINATMSVNAIVDEYNSGSLQTILTGCAGLVGTDIALVVKNRCDQDNELIFLMKNAQLDNQNFSLDLEGNETVDLTFSAQIGGRDTTDAGVFCSGAFGTGNHTGTF